jgi:hypothetical protein
MQAILDNYSIYNYLINLPYNKKVDFHSFSNIGKITAGDPETRSIIESPISLRLPVSAVKFK